MENKNPQEFLEELCKLCSKYVVSIYMPSFNDGYDDIGSASFNGLNLRSLYASPYEASFHLEEVKEYKFKKELIPALSLEAK